MRKSKDFRKDAVLFSACDVYTYKNVFSPFSTFISLALAVTHAQMYLEQTREVPKSRSAPTSHTTIYDIHSCSLI